MAKPLWRDDVEAHDHGACLVCGDKFVDGAIATRIEQVQVALGRGHSGYTIVGVPKVAFLCEACDAKQSQRSPVDDAKDGLSAELGELVDHCVDVLRRNGATTSDVQSLLLRVCRVLDG